MRRLPRHPECLRVTSRTCANTEETLILMNLYPLENAEFAGRGLHSDNPLFVEGMKQLNG